MLLQNNIFCQCIENQSGPMLLNIFNVKYALLQKNLIQTSQPAKKHFREVSRKHNPLPIPPPPNKKGGQGYDISPQNMTLLL